VAAAAGTASLALLWVRRSLARVVGAIGGLLDGVGMVDWVLVVSSISKPYVGTMSVEHRGRV